MTIQEELKELDAALSKLYATGQMYQQGSRKLQRPEYATMLKRKAELMSALVADEETGYFGDAYVAEFHGR